MSWAPRSPFGRSPTLRNPNGIPNRSLFLQAGGCSDQNVQLGITRAAIAKHEIATHIGGTARVLLDLRLLKVMFRWSRGRSGRPDPAAARRPGPQPRLSTATRWAWPSDRPRRRTVPGRGPGPPYPDEIPRDSADRTGRRPASQRRQLVARVLTAGSSLLLTNARCADATCTFTVDFTDFSRLRPSTAASRVNAPANRPQDQIPERAGPRGWRTGVTAWSPQPRSSP
jgi:hypothetical protein